MFCVKSLLFHTLEANEVVVMQYDNLSHLHTIKIQWKSLVPVPIYCICSCNLRTFFSILAAEKSGCVKYADFFCGGLDLGFIPVF